ncbi:ketosteroid isomerase-like protein [Halorubrum trapanicum]|uniref:Ketosteroid isomerase-like protein n=1 Tax=Halorubrum trapanicum TaxID=29284 RepID=A0A8J7UN90_9EURY|nr:nuclear transport factor 2 family protein [Halorubrum trapanicum]MBP1902884.1 ketosteroid isomerase-like protein [Halorubrum trapanicum]
MARTPRETVEEFFERMGDPDERRTVGELFADDAVVTVPGARFEGPDAAASFLEFLTPRYERASKAFGRWTVDGDRVVSQGTLHGVDNDGTHFEDVRYVDVYEVREGAIRRLDVYNDLAVEGVVEP